MLRVLRHRRPLVAIASEQWLRWQPMLQGFQPRSSAVEGCYPSGDARGRQWFPEALAAAACGLGFATVMAWKQRVAVCEEVVEVPVLTYNVLCPELARPSHYYNTDPKDLDPDTRYAKVKARLDEAIAGGTIIALQEVDLAWAGKLHAYFVERGYCAVFAQYGHDGSGYMGIMQAWPIDKYEAKEVEIHRLADTAPKEVWPKSSPAPPLPTGTLSRNEVKELIGGPIPSLPNDFNEWDTAKWRKNEVISVRLKPRREGAKSFVVSSYHMPCLFGTAAKERCMNIHLMLLLRHMQTFAKGDPCMLMGDFNTKPDLAGYKLVLEGGDLEAIGDAAPQQVEGLKDRLRGNPPFPGGLQSAYLAFHGKEPAFTNYAESGMNNFVFCATLDYIWYTPESLKVVQCPPLPSSTDQVDGPFPSPREPSDHLPLKATFRLV